MNGQMITNVHEDIVKVLIDRIDQKHEGAGLTYDDLCKLIGNQVHCRNVASYLGDISSWCDDIGAPMLSVLVSNRNNNRPGKGFYRLYADLHGTPVRLLDEDLIYVSEYKKVIGYNKWEDLKFYLGI